MALRRIRARRLRRRFSDTWPLNEAAGRVPADWKGWPNGKKFAFVLTHDVEGKRGLNRCSQLAELEIRLGFRSSFNFIPEGEYEAPAALRRFLTDHGFEVGVHDLRHDGSLYRSRQGFMEDAARINRYLETWGSVGFRSGFMLHNLQWLHRLNIAYDSSTFDTDPFEPQPDGANTIFPFWVSESEGAGYVELPYTLAQDSTLFLLLGETSIDIWARKLDSVAEQGGMALVDVHPDYMNFNHRTSAREYDVQLYENLLEYVLKRYSTDCWFALPREVARHVQGSRVTKARAWGRSGDLTAMPLTPSRPEAAIGECLRGKRMAVVTFSSYPGDPRPRRAAEAFAREGVNVEVLCLSDSRETRRRETFNGVAIRRIPLRHHRGGALEYVLRYSLFIIMAFGILAARSVRRRYHLVHVHNMPDVLVLAALVPKVSGAGIMLDLHDPMPELMMTIFNLQKASWPVRMLGRLEEVSIAFADAVITVNRACEQLFASRSCEPAKIHVVMNSPDESIFPFKPPQARRHRKNGADAPFVIMYHGTMVERNGVDLAVEALARLRQSVPTAELRLYGSSTPFLERVLRAVKEQGLDTVVQYLGPRRLEELAVAIQECDVGVIPNRRSIFTEINTPTRIFEYLALGKPVIAPQTPGIRDYFGDDALITFELGDTADLAAKLAQVYFNPNDTVAIVKRGQSVYRAHTWHEEQAELVKLAVSLLHKKRGRGE